MKKIILCLLFSCASLQSQEKSYTPQELLQLATEGVMVMEKEPLKIDRALRLGADYYQKKSDKQFLVSLLKHYPAIFKKDPNHYIVEMFTDIYKKDRAQFEKILSEAVDKNTAAEFMERLKLAASEEVEGNG